MQQIRFGRTEVEVPRLSLGTWGHSGPATVRRHPVGWSGHDDRLALAALTRGWELGLTHWDTADVYGDGQAERLIGSLWNTVPREDIFLATKVGWDLGGHGHFYHPDLIRERLERSLQYLRTDHVDLYYLHHCEFGLDDRYLDGALEAMHRLREEGKFRFLGLSDWNPAKVLALLDRVDPDVIQPYRNLLDDGYHESGLAEAATARDLGVAFFSPLKHGLLLGKYDAPPEFGQGDHRARIPEFADPAILARMQRYAEEIRRRFPEDREAVLRALVGALLDDAPGACALVGLRNPAHAESAAAAGEPLAAEEASWIRALYREEGR